jgi:3-oxoacyl-[acyl-carrier-protein] synthase III
MARFAHIVGWGMSVPKRVMTNDDWAQLVDTSDEWVRSRTGIGERRIAGEGETTFTLALEAAHEALDVARLSPAQLDLIIVATLTPEHAFPATACLVRWCCGGQRQRNARRHFVQRAWLRRVGWRLPDFAGGGQQAPP